MNISIRRLQENDGSGLEDRPAYVAESLTPKRRVGWRDGLPLVEPEGGVPEDTRLGDDMGPLYEHYRRGDNLLLPDAGGFLRRLCESPEVGSLSDVAEELNTDRETVEKGVSLHGIDTPLEDDDGDDGAEGVSEGIELPSGEAVPYGPLHPLTLAQLLSDGMSVEEISLYLSEQTGDRVTPAEVREAARQYDLLDGGGGDGSDRIALPSEKMQAGSGDVRSTPWE